MGMKRQMCGAFRDTHVTHHSSPQKKFLEKTYISYTRSVKSQQNLEISGVGLGVGWGKKGVGLPRLCPLFMHFPCIFPGHFATGIRNVHMSCAKKRQVAEAVPALKEDAGSFGYCWINHFQQGITSIVPDSSSMFFSSSYVMMIRRLQDNTFGNFCKAPTSRFSVASEPSIE